ncbi:MAG TPA: class II aldolase/adducin family protein [Gammaproteobacteria bacterium]|nr:class II aldolase/adducin family protein [Gammaproteobacteria bacterium]
MIDSRQQLVQYYHWLRQYGLNDSHSGNASVRNGDTFWVTPTGACADTLDPGQLVSCGIEDGHGGARASLDAPLHAAVYRNNRKARAVLHSHGPHSVALTLDGQPFTPIDFEGGFYFTQVPVIDIPYDQYVERAPELVAAALADHPIAIVRGHGVYAQAESLDRAYKWTCSLELSARTAFIARLAGVIDPLTPPSP